MKLYNYIAENMVFQQNKDIIIRGVDFDGSINAILINKASTAKYSPIEIEYNNSKFKIVFPKLKGSYDEYKLILKDTNSTLELNRLFVGDVFLSAGQSNMSYSLGCTLKNEKYKKLVSHFPIFCLNILENEITKEGYVNRPAYPQEDISKEFSWQQVTEDNAYNFSALSVMLAVKLSKNVNYPIAFICTSMGGVSIDSYLPYDICKENEEIYGYLSKTGKFIENKDDYNTFGPANYTQTAGIFNEKIYPLKDFSFKFMLWYQGENSCFDFESGKYYYEALKQLIISYRKFFDDDKLPFIKTGIHSHYYPYGDKFGCLYIQEAIAKVSGEGIYYVPIYDLEDIWLKKTDMDLYYHPIHPINKEEVSNRYFNIVYQNIYQNKEYYFPYVNNVNSQNGKLYLEIKCAVKGLKINSEYFGFTIAGVDKIYYAAKAVAVSNNLIELSSPEVGNPLYYTYGLLQYAEFANCKTLDNLPLVQSRSNFEDYKDSTYLFDQIVFGCDYLKLIENNFGFEVGGGMYSPIFDQGDIIKSKIKIKLDSNNKTEGKNSLLLIAKPKRESYHFFSIKVNNGLSGLINRFDDFNYLTLDLKADSDCEFHGILFRTQSHIYKFNVLTEVLNFPYCKLTNDFCSYSISLEQIFDGAETPMVASKEILKSIHSFELYFRSNKEVMVNIDNIRLTNTKYTASHKKENSNLDTSIVINKAGE